MGFIGGIFRDMLTVPSLMKYAQSDEVKEILNEPGGYVTAFADDSCAVKFVYPETILGDTNLTSYNLMYAVEREDGLYDIGGSDTRFIEEGQGSSVDNGVLDHIPIDGEYVLGWIPYDESIALDYVVAVERARKCRDVNGFSGNANGFILCKDVTLYKPFNPDQMMGASEDAKLVVCSLDPDDIQVQADGSVIARIPSDLSNTGKAWVSVRPEEVVDDEWHAGKKALILKNDYGRHYTLEDPSTSPEVKEAFTQVLVGHAKVQQQIEREAEWARNGKPAYKPLAQVWPPKPEPLPEPEKVVIEGVDASRVEDVKQGAFTTSSLKKVSIPFDMASKGSADVYVFSGEVGEDPSNPGKLRMVLGCDTAYTLELNVPAKDVAALGLDVKKDLGLRANGVDTRLQIVMPADEIKQHVDNAAGGPGSRGHAVPPSWQAGPR